jgi:MarR family transcriptional regulator, lower aerobic nicotinate degradation pathway regulator
MATSSPLQDMYRRPGFLLKRCHQISMAIFLDECREFNITQSQYGCLRALQEFPGVDQIALGRLVGLDRSTASMVIKALSERGLIERVVNSRDKRRMRLKVSKSGEKLLTAITPAAARAQTRVIGGLPTESRATFLDLLEKFLAGHAALIDVHEVLAALPGPDIKSAQQARQSSGRGRPRRASRTR